MRSPLPSLPPAREFLLSLPYPNLFSPLDARERDALVFECKGCGHVVKRWEREEHYEAHRTARRDVGVSARLAALERGRETRRKAKA